MSISPGTRLDGSPPGKQWILFGILVAGLGVRVHRWEKMIEHAIPTGGTPTHA